MGKYFELAEKLSEKYSAEIMCMIIGAMTDDEIDKMICKL